MQTQTHTCSIYTSLLVRALIDIMHSLALNHNTINYRPKPNYYPDFTQNLILILKSQFTLNSKIFFFLADCSSSEARRQASPVGCRRVVGGHGRSEAERPVNNGVSFKKNRKLVIVIWPAQSTVAEAAVIHSSWRQLRYLRFRQFKFVLLLEVISWSNRNGKDIIYIFYSA